MLIVTGGYKDGQYLSSTEVFDYSQGSPATWREVGTLPSPRRGLRGARVAGVYYVSGGAYYDGSNQYYGDILAWSPDTESWSPAGTMETPRYYYAVTEVTLAQL